MSIFMDVEAQRFTHVVSHRVQRCLQYIGYIDELRDRVLIALQFLIDLLAIPLSL
jgi:hypothetical protein